MSKTKRRVHPCPGNCRNGWIQVKSKSGAGWIKVRCNSCGGKGYVTR